MTASTVTSPGTWLHVSHHHTYEADAVEETELRQRARVAIESRRMPNRHPDRLWGGPGVGAPCPICGRPVTKDEMEFEVQFAKDGNPSGRADGDGHLDVFHVHVRCFSAWDLERTV